MSVELYEGNGGQQSMIKKFQADELTHLSEKVNPNDEARSMRLVNVPANMYIGVYDAKNASQKDDYTQIWTKREVSSHTISSFESSYEDDDVNVVHTHKNGLDGKVSYIEIHRAGSSAPSTLEGGIA